MPPRDQSDRIADILEAIQRIRQYTHQLTFDEFSMNSMVIDAVLHNFAIIGDAVVNLTDDIRDKYTNIEWSEIKRMRNILVHTYWGVDLNIVWTTIAQDLVPTQHLEAIRAERRD